LMDGLSAGRSPPRSKEEEEARKKVSNYFNIFHLKQILSHKGLTSLKY